MSTRDRQAPGWTTREAPRNDGPLSGVRVVSLEGLGPAPFITMLLADMGADVLRVKRPSHRPAQPLEQTSGLSPEQDVVNRGTRSVAIDLKTADGVEEVLRLVELADVLIEGFRPGVVERLGLGPVVVLERNPAVVFARVTGYGQQGDRATTPGHDINYVAQSGALHAMGHPGQRPRPPINLLGDYGGGGALGAFGIACALVESVRSGTGQVIDVAMVDGVALLTAKLQGLRAAGLFHDEPGTNSIDSGAPFYDTYRCSDGRYIAVAALEEKFYEAFLAGLGAETASWPDRDDRDNWPELRRLIESTIETRSMADWTAVFEGTDACVTPVLTFDEASGDPHNASRELFVAAGGALQPSPAPRLSRTPARRPGTPSHEDADATEVLDTWRANAASPEAGAARPEGRDKT